MKVSLIIFILHVKIIRSIINNPVTIGEDIHFGIPLKVGDSIKVYSSRKTVEIEAEGVVNAPKNFNVEFDSSVVFGTGFKRTIYVSNRRITIVSGGQTDVFFPFTKGNKFLSLIFYSSNAAIVVGSEDTSLLFKTFDENNNLIESSVDTGQAIKTLSCTTSGESSIFCIIVVDDGGVSTAKGATFSLSSSSKTVTKIGDAQNYTSLDLSESYGVELKKFSKVLVSASASKTTKVEVTFYENVDETFGFNPKLTLLDSCNPSVKDLAFGKIDTNKYLLCCAAERAIKCQRFTKTNPTPYPSFNIPTTESNFFTQVLTNTTLSFIIWESLTDNKVYSHFIYFPTCPAIQYTFPKGKKNTILLDQPQKTNSQIFVSFTDVPDPNQIGTLYLLTDRTSDTIKQPVNAGQDYQTAAPYGFLLELIDSNALLEDSLSFTLKNAEGYESSQCTVEIKTCNSKCGECSSAETQSSHGCGTCEVDYYFSPLQSENCFSINEKQKNWYLPPSSSKFEECMNLCEECVDGVSCTSCITGYAKIESTSTSSTCLKIDELHEDYYYSKNDGIFKKCYEKCRTCDGGLDGNNQNCLTCKISGEYLIDGEKNCASSSIKDSGYYMDSSDNKWHKCHSNCETCSRGADSQSQHCTKCKTNLFFYNNDCLQSCPPKTKEYSGSCIQDVIKTESSSSKFLESTDKSTLSDLSKDQTTVKGSNFTMEIFNYQDKEKLDEKNGDKKLSKVDLGECYNILKVAYGIKDNEDIIMIKIDKNITNSSVNQVDFILYDYNGNVLDTSLCKKTSISITKPILNERGINLISAKDLKDQGIDVFNPNDTFFNNICNPYTSNKSTDVVLSDRRNDFFQNASFCEDNCEYEQVFYNNNSVACKCVAKSKVETEEDIHNEKFSLTNAKNVFLSSISSSNIIVVKCIGLVFNVKILVKNLGFWVIGSLYLMQVILLIAFLIRGFKKLYNMMFVFLSAPINRGKGRSRSVIYNPHEVKFVPSQLESIQEIQENNNEQKIAPLKKPSPISLSLSPKRESPHRRISFNNNLIFHASLDNSPKKNDMQINSKRFSTINSFNTNPAKEKKDAAEIESNHTLESYYGSGSGSGAESKKLRTKSTSTSLIKIPFSKESNPFLRNRKVNRRRRSSEIFMASSILNNYNELSYEEALNIDDRTFCITYWDLLKENQIVLNTFKKTSFFELRIIKTLHLLLSIGLEFSLNALFYTDSYISDTYYNNGVLDMISSLPKSIYSCLIGFIIGFLLSHLSNSKEKIESLIKESSKMDNKEYEAKFLKVIRQLKVKIVFYFTLDFLILLFFWYYSAAFCAVYQNSQLNWVIGSVTSILITHLTPCFFCLFMALLRGLGLKYKSKCLYTSSKLLNYLV